MAKEVKYHGSSKKDLNKFPHDMCHDALHQINRVANGLMPVDWKAMNTVGPGAKEIRLRDKNGIYRVIYLAEFKGLLHVLHAFQKKSIETKKLDIDLAKIRYKAMKNE